MLPILLYVLLFFQSSSAVNYYTYRRPKRNPPEWSNLLSIDELALRGGYHSTNYEVITEDGYSLWLHRIGNNTGPPVLIQHGVLVAADQWITRGANRDLAFILLKEGYDVWLSNLRGSSFNEYSLKYPKSDPRFWEYSVHENGVYDVPAFIDTILDIRGLDQLFYIGHSQGTTVFFVMCSARPEYNNKIRAAILMSPIAYTPTVPEQTSILRIATSNSEFLVRLFQKLGIYAMSTRTELTIQFLRETCAKNEYTRYLCFDFFGLVSGDDRTNLNLDEWNFFVPYYGAGTSMNVALHFGQIYSTGEFKALDLGTAGNLEKYGKAKPPHYDLKLVTVPNALIWGYNDILTSESSVNRIAAEVQNNFLVRAVPDPKFNHIDMYIANNAPDILYPEIVQILNSIMMNKSPEVIRKMFEDSPYSKIKKQPLLSYKMKSDETDLKQVFALTERFTQLYSIHDPSSKTAKKFISYLRTGTIGL